MDLNWSFFKKEVTSFPQRYYYESLVNKYRDVSSYEKLKEMVCKKQTVLATKGIYKSYSFSKQDAYKRHGRSQYFFIINASLKMELLYYRIMLGGHKVKLEMHFKEDELFHCSYRFSYLKDTQKQEIINIIEQKYFGGEHLDYRSNNISDVNKTTINIEDSIDFTINYLFYGNSDFFEIIETLKSKKIENRLKRKMKEARDLYRDL